MKKLYCNKGYLNALGFNKKKLLEDLIRLAGGKTFSGEYIKLDGSKRVFNGRQFIVGSTVGGKDCNSDGQLAYIDNEIYISLLRKWEKTLGRDLTDEEKAEVAKKSWRSFKVERLKRFQSKKIQYIFDVEL